MYQVLTNPMAYNNQLRIMINIRISTQIAAYTAGGIVFSDTMLGLKKYNLYSFLHEKHLNNFLENWTKYYHCDETVERGNDHNHEVRF